MKPYISIRLAGVGASVKIPGMGETQLPLSGEGVMLFTNSPLKFYWGATSGGVVGFSSLRTKPFPVPDSLSKDFANLSNWSIRVKVADMVLGSSKSDIEVTFYKPDGTPLPPSVHRVSCEGVVLGSIDIDATLTAKNISGSPLEKYEKDQFAKIKQS
jgi:hypothetical protein